ncbi:hypothetical protein CANTEDRAFT_108873 [Yamadazyma tenuis ATCC 10573]|uniref:Uncharacterized protein n=1 Tax=Candida tenuis (strain ATCC 10573 / BCRC 21748 / CBS 615 / JCM 9827 / NBRC 10315 / NRRL Y-1498 / VKM Y-70) TaxID=590646 RepID=G3BAL7_CANTC|nr:uncharacterized protein CANTEDRAFT_108873 [Yamadazyma tenuis ATCC 10573]EGV61435.1 hypothetical protein CANTEDRAFT_108873 [Yamadazyma tenuis ATCC 10573]
MALKKGASLQTNSPDFPPSAGVSDPKRSIKSVCSDKLIRIKSFPVALAMAEIKSVFPTPGLPSNKIGLCTCIASITRMALDEVVGACNKKSSIGLEITLGIVKDPADKVSDSNEISKSDK